MTSQARSFAPQSFYDSVHALNDLSGGKTAVGAFLGSHKNETAAVDLPLWKVVENGLKNPESILIQGNKDASYCKQRTYGNKLGGKSLAIGLAHRLRESGKNRGNIKAVTPFAGDWDQVDQNASELLRLPERIGRLSTAKNMAIQNACQIFINEKLCHQPEAKRIIDELKNCSSFLEFHYYFTHPEKLVKLSKTNSCDLRFFCPVCGIRRSARTMQAYLPKIKAVNDAGHKMQLLTFTVKNGNDLSGTFKHLAKSIKTFLDRGRRARKYDQNQNTEARHISGTIGSYEIIRGKGGQWHPHMHAIISVDGEINIDNLRREWEEITKDSKNIDLRDIKDLEIPENLKDVDFEAAVDGGETPLINAVLEVFKYSTKFKNADIEDLWHIHENFKGVQLLRSSGLFRGVKVSQELIDEPISVNDLPYIRLLFHHVKLDYTQTKIEFCIDKEI